MQIERQAGRVTVRSGSFEPGYGIGAQLRCFAICFTAICIYLLLGFVSESCHAQDDFYPLPVRNVSGFGFPYPPPAPDEPGVTFNRRYMLDGHPDLEFNPRPQDEIWLVSTREIQNDECRNGSVPLDRFVCKHSVGTAWNQVPFQQLIDVQQKHSDMATVIFIHGNRTSALWARRRAKHAYQLLLGNNPPDPPPTRFVIWSWPSDPLLRPVEDFQKKMDRAVIDGLLFGQFLSVLDHSRPLKLVTYSLGTQVAFTGIETVSNQTGSCPAVDMIAMAPVNHCRWPLSQWQLETTASRIQRLRLFQNDDDLAIIAFKAYCSLICKTCYRTGADILREIHPNVRHYEVGDGVGQEHNILAYVSLPEVRRELESFLRR